MVYDRSNHLFHILRFMPRWADADAGAEAHAFADADVCGRVFLSDPGVWGLIYGSQEVVET